MAILASKVGPRSPVFGANAEAIQHLRDDLRLMMPLSLCLSPRRGWRRPVARRFRRAISRRRGWHQW
jgi:hypothetical protein